MLQFSQFVWALSYSVWDVFNNFLLVDATDRSKNSGDQKRFFYRIKPIPLSFFANTPFNSSENMFNVNNLEVSQVILGSSMKLRSTAGGSLWKLISNSANLKM